MPPWSADVGNSVFYPGHGFLSIVASVRLLLGGRFNLESVTFYFCGHCTAAPAPSLVPGKTAAGAGQGKALWWPSGAMP